MNAVFRVVSALESNANNYRQYRLRLVRLWSEPAALVLSHGIYPNADTTRRRLNFDERQCSDQHFTWAPVSNISTYTRSLCRKQNKHL